MQILVVDDYEPFARSLRHLLLDEHQVTIATSRTSAIALLGEAGAFDVVLLDLNLAGESGLDVYEHLRTRAPDVASRVVFMTGGFESGQVADALSQLDVPRLEKPFREGELREALQRCRAA